MNTSSPKQKAVLVTCNDLPIFSDNGVSVYLWSLAKALHRKGFEVHVISFNTNISQWVKVFNKKSLNEIEQTLKDEDIFAHLLTPNPTDHLVKGKLETIRRTLLPRPSDFYNGFEAAPLVKKLIDEIKPSLVLTWMANATASVLPNTHNYRLIGLVTDIDPLVRKNRLMQWQNNTIQRQLIRFRKTIMDLKLPGIYVTLFQNCDRIVCNARHHTDWFIKKGLKEVQYFPIAVMDRNKSGMISAHSANQNNQMLPQICLIGNVQGIASLTGLRFLCNEMMKDLSEVHSQTPFELIIAGRGELEPDLNASFLKYPWIRRLGFVEDISQMFLSSTIFLVPTPISLGFRTRIAEAFSYGSCVIAHRANAEGMPELENEINILLPGNGKEMVKAIERCLESYDLRESLGKAARKTFEEKYDGSKIADQIVDYCTW